MQHCLECGYSRRGIERAAACPECGAAGDLETRRAEVGRQLRRPLRLLGRTALLRRPMTGWWELVRPRDRRPRWARLAPLTAIVSMLLLAVWQAGAAMVTVDVVMTSVVDGTGPSSARRAELRGHYSLAPGFARVSARGWSGAWTTAPKTRFTIERRFTIRTQPYVVVSGTVGGAVVALYGFILWSLLRFGWTNLLVVRRPDLDRGTRRGMRWAADAGVIVLPVLLSWMVVIDLLSFGASFFVDHLSVAHPADRMDWMRRTARVGAVIGGLTATFGPPLVWWQCIAADRSRRLFRRRWLALGLLALAGVLAMIVARAIGVFVVRLGLSGFFEYLGNLG